VDVAGRADGASPHRLIALLYEDLGLALRQAAFAIDAGKLEAKSRHITKAVAILFALESGLDFTKGGDLSETLSRMYRGARERTMAAGVLGDSAVVRNVAESVADLAGAWNSIAP